MKDKEVQVDQEQPVSASQIVLVSICIVVLIGVLWCTLHFNLYATG